MKKQQNKKLALVKKAISNLENIVGGLAPDKCTCDCCTCECHTNLSHCCAQL